MKPRNVNFSIPTNKMDVSFIVHAMINVFLKSWEILLKNKKVICHPNIEYLSKEHLTRSENSLIFEICIQFLIQHVERKKQVESQINHAYFHLNIKGKNTINAQLLIMEAFIGVGQHFLLLINPGGVRAQLLVC